MDNTNTQQHTPGSRCFGFAEVTTDSPATLAPHAPQKPRSYKALEVYRKLITCGRGREQKQLRDHRDRREEAEGAREAWLVGVKG